MNGYRPSARRDHAGSGRQNTSSRHPGISKPPASIAKLNLVYPSRTRNNQLSLALRGFCRSTPFSWAGCRRPRIRMRCHDLKMDPADPVFAGPYFSIGHCRQMRAEIGAERLEDFLAVS